MPDLTGPFTGRGNSFPSAPGAPGNWRGCWRELQLLTSYESKNGRRFVTGFLFGLAFDSILVYFHRACVMAAAELVKLFIRDGAAVDRARDLFL